MKEFVDGDEYTEIAREVQIALELSTIDQLLPYLLERKWTLVRARADAGGFVTSDHPVCLTWNDPARHGGIYSPGFGLRGTEVLFPLTADLALFGSFEGEEDELDADILLVANCNTTIIAFAERQVFAADPDFAYLRKGPMPSGRGEELLGDGSFIRPRPKRPAG